MKYAVIALVAVPALLLASMTWVVVRVQASPPDGNRLWIPVPVALAKAAVGLASPSCIALEGKVLPDELKLTRSIVQRLVEEVEGVDVELAFIEEGGQSVRVAVETGDLRIQVDHVDEVAEVRWPLSSLRAAAGLLEYPCIDVADALGVLSESSGGHVHVRNHSDIVDVWVW